ncbi:MAG: histidine phosphatase family protein [Desulfocapsaceae bacterium]|nr:histidine phosphatase family protein [Desulfocapsaceae bacterium]
MNIYLVRHGSVSRQFNNIIIGQTDIPLSGKGENDIACLAQLMSGLNIKINKIYSSDLFRAERSAFILSKVLKKNHQFNIDRRLRELNSGVFEGKSRDYLNRFRTRFDFPNEAKPENGESINEVRDRVYDFLNDLLQKKIDDCLVVTHYHPITLIYKMASNIYDFEKKYGELNPRHSSISKIEYSFKSRQLKIINIINIFYPNRLSTDKINVISI